MASSGSALLHYPMIISLQILTQMIKLNTAGFLRIQGHNMKIKKRLLKRTLKQTTIVQKRFPD